MDLWDALKKEIGGELVSRVAGFLGESDASTKKAVEGAVPTVLAGLAGLAGNTRGAEQIYDAARSAAASDRGDVLGALAGGRTGSLLEEGQRLLSTLFGSGATDTAANAVARYAGFSDGRSSKSLLGMLLPLVLGFLGRRANKEGLDASSLGGLLLRNRDVFLKLIPAALGALLPKTGAFGAPAAGARVPAGAGQGRGGLGRLLPILLALVAAFVVWRLMAPKAPPEAPPAQTRLDPVAHLQDLVGTFTRTLSGIEGGGSVAEAATTLARIDAELDGAIDAASRLGGEARARARDAVTLQLSQLADAGTLQRVLDGAGRTLGAETRAILAKLRTFAAE